MRQFLLLSHLHIHNANALSSPYTIGFPAMTAWMGAVHSLQRHLHQQGFKKLNFTKVAISCHAFDLQTYKGKGDFVHSIIGTSNPLGKNGDRPAFIEEARCHLEVSLLIEYNGLDVDDPMDEKFEDLVNTHIHRMKWASGDLLPFKPTKVERFTVDEYNDKEVKNALQKLMVGYILIERRDLIIKSMQEEGKDALDALLDYLKVTHRPIEDNENKIIWTSKRKQPGWLIPIAVGFQGISQLGKAKNQRDEDTPHCFAESVITLGEFVMPYRIRNLDRMLWQYDEVKNHLYICRNDIPSTSI